MKTKIMKWNSPPALMAMSIIMLGLNPSNSSAQVGGSNGGDPNELAEFVGKDNVHLDSWYKVKMNLIRWAQQGKFSQLDLGTFTTKEFVKTAVDTLQETKVQWDDKEIIVQGVPRICENYIDAEKVKHIHCNRTEYAKSMIHYDAETQYKFIAHEYFSLAGFEPNTYGVSDYFISSQISSSLDKFQGEELRIGLQAGIAYTSLLRSKGEMYGVAVKYISPETGLTIPVSVQLGKDLTQFAIGVGYTYEQFKNVASYSVIAALANLRAGNNYNWTERDKSHIAFLIQQEVNFQLTKRLRLGMNFNVDLFNFIRVEWQKEKQTPYDASKGVDRQGWKAKEQTDRNYAVNSAKKSSMTSFGLTLRYDLFKKQK